jgi:hypothetical protein
MCRGEGSALFLIKGKGVRLLHVKLGLSEFFNEVTYDVPVDLEIATVLF